MARTYSHFEITATRRPWVDKALPIIGRTMALAVRFLPDSAVDRLISAASTLLVKYGVKIEVEPR